MADQAYADYVEFSDGSSPSPAPRKSLWAAAVSAVLLVSASVAYTGGVETPSFNWPWQSDKHVAPVATPPALKGSSSLMAQQTRLGNRVVLTFPNGPIRDGTVARGVLSVAEWAREFPPSTVELASQGLRCTPKTFSFTAYTLEQSVSCRTVAGTVSAAENNQVVAVPVTFSYPFSPFCNAETQNVQRLRLSAGRCSAWGDPHLTTFDGVNYDFQPDGVFRYFTASGLEVQVFQEKCPPFNTGKAWAPSCYRAMSIIYADSVLRLSLDDTNKITVIRGTESMRWFELYKFGGNTEGYRIFLLADDTSYIDITVGLWVNNYGYLNIVAQLSPFFRDPNMIGLMGNWNGNPADDSRDVNALTTQNRYPMEDNAFVCTDCSRWTRAPSETDEVGRQMRVPNDNLRQGFTLIDINGLPLQTYTPAFRPLPAVAAVALQAASNVSERAKELCPQVINSVPICDKYVANRQFFIENVCIADSTMVGDISTVENTKIAYLRECRREIEARIIGAVGEPETIKALTEDRDRLEFGDLTLCPQNCNGRGSCLAAGCECNQGFTGYTCDIKI